MNISARVNSSNDQHEVFVDTNGSTRSLTIPPKANKPGSSVNGGELLFLALATCYCNDIYREAEKQGITVRHVEVTVEGDFDSVPGSRASNVTYSARVEAEASEQAILDLMRHTDTVAEIQNTLRDATPVVLTHTEAISVS